jgi:hypothetical protein
VGRAGGESGEYKGRGASLALHADGEILARASSARALARGGGRDWVKLREQAASDGHQRRAGRAGGAGAGSVSEDIAGRQAGGRG